MEKNEQQQGQEKLNESRENREEKEEEEKKLFTASPCAFLQVKSTPCAMLE